MPITFVLNGTSRQIEPRSDETLLESLRERCGITSLKDGCSPQGQCGCCLALIDGNPKVTCATPAAAADGKEILTLEGLPAAERTLSFAEAGFQAGRFDVFRLLAAARDSLRVRARRIDAIETAWVARIELERAVGGEVKS